MFKLQGLHKLATFVPLYNSLKIAFSLLYWNSRNFKGDKPITM